MIYTRTITVDPTGRVTESPMVAKDPWDDMCAEEQEAMIREAEEFADRRLREMAQEGRG